MDPRTFDDASSRRVPDEQPAIRWTPGPVPADAENGLWLAGQKGDAYVVIVAFGVHHVVIVAFGVHHVVGFNAEKPGTVGTHHARIQPPEGES